MFHVYSVELISSRTHKFSCAVLLSHENHFLDPVGVGEMALPMALGLMKFESVKKYITKDVPTTSNVSIELNSPSFQLQASKFPACQSGSYFLN